jgi:hypothetical protein
MRTDWMQGSLRLDCRPSDSGAQWKKLIKVKKMKEGTWAVEKSTGKAPSFQDMGLFDGDLTCRF